MTTYESKQVQILRPAAEIFDRISRFDALTPALDSKVDAWQADADSCSFRAKGFAVALRIVERETPRLVKIRADEASALPIDFTFWLQLQPVSEHDTRLRLVLHANLNMMMRMMLGNKIQPALDQVAEGLAQSLSRKN